MSKKRQREKGKAPLEGDAPVIKRRKSTRLFSVVQEVVWSLHAKQLLGPVLQPLLDPLIRRAVKVEVELALRKYLPCGKCICEKETNSLEARSLQLKFLNGVSLPVFTYARIEGDERQPIRIGLVEPLTGQIVTSGPESSAKVEVVVLEGDHNGSKWTAEDFEDNIVRQREGKKPLLKGDVCLVLKDGVGIMGKICFTDNSSWLRSHKFILGARVVDQFDGVKIREAKTEAFVVRDKRGGFYEKHYPPSPSDEVWRLKNIRKDGTFHKRLSQENINTVKDFLARFYINPSNLQHILGTSMSPRMWEATVGHAQTCVLDTTVYLYYPPAFQKTYGVVFNDVAQVRGLLKDCQYVPLDKLSGTEKAAAQEMVVAAFSQWEEVIPFNNETSLVGGGFSGFTDNTLFSSSSPVMLTYTASENLASHNPGEFDHSTGDYGSSAAFFWQGLDNTDPISYNQTTTYPYETDDPLMPDIEPMPPALCDDYHMLFFNDDIIQSSQNLGLKDSEADLQRAVDGFICHQRVTAVAQMRWSKLFSVLKWFSIRRRVCLRRAYGRCGCS